MEEQKTCRFLKLKNKCSSFAQTGIFTYPFQILAMILKRHFHRKLCSSLNFSYLTCDNHPVTLHLLYTLHCSWRRQQTPVWHWCRQHRMQRENDGQHFLGWPYLLVGICNSSPELQFKAMLPCSYQIRYLLEKSPPALLLLVTFSAGRQNLHCWPELKLQLELLEKR